MRERERERESERERERERERQSDRETERQRERATERQKRESDRYKEFRLTSKAFCSPNKILFTYRFTTECHRRHIEI